MGGNFLFRISELTQRERICSFCKLQIFISQTTDSHFANYRFSLRKLRIFISQTTDFHFANYRFSFHKLQISISQTTDFHFFSSHFVSSHFVSFHFVSSHFVSQTTVSHVITDRCMIANMFNNFFANGGKDLACSIPNVEMSPLEDFKNSSL